MKDLSLHILDIAENSIRANASLVEVTVEERLDDDLLRLEIRDDGSGMDEEMRQSAMSPFSTERTERRVGLGLALLAQAAREADGTCGVESTLGEGTRIIATFKHSHIDRKPLGDLGMTFLTLAMGYPDVDFRMEINTVNDTECLDTRIIRAADHEQTTKGEPPCLPRPS